jgi:HlyD family secretion protein
MTKRLFCLSWFSLLSACLQVPDTEEDFRTAFVEKRDIVVVVESAGVIQPHRTVEVKSKASGEILSIHAETGDFIEEGTLLVQIDKRSPRNQLALVESQREAALARRSIAEAQHERATQLFKSHSINEVDYDNSVLELADAKADVIRMQISIENARFALDDTEVKAPITGTIIEKLVEKGQVISSPTMDVGGGTVLMKMADLRTVKVQALVNEIDIGRIRRGQQVTVTVTSFPDQPFRGEVFKVEPQALPEQAVTSFPVLISLENDRGLLRPGMNADVEILVDQRLEVVAVPTSAIRTMTDVGVTATLIGLDEYQLRRQLEQQEEGDGASDTIAVSGRDDRYWVLEVSGQSFQPVFVETGITDLDYSEVVDGLDIGAEVLLLPSSGLVRTQRRSQQLLTRWTRTVGINRRSD